MSWETDRAETAGRWFAGDEAVAEYARTVVDPSATWRRLAEVAEAILCPYPEDLPEPGPCPHPSLRRGEETGWAWICESCEEPVDRDEPPSDIWP